MAELQTLLTPGEKETSPKIRPDIPMPRHACLASYLSKHLSAPRPKNR